MINPFKKATPSVFAVCSPFQLLCGIAAMKQLEIQDALFLICEQDNNQRNDQMLFLCKKYNLKHKVIRIIGSLKYRFFMIRAYISRGGRYNRLFIGDMRSNILSYVGSLFVTDAADIVYLDDGNITISFLENRFIPEEKCLSSFMTCLSKKRRMCFFRNILTIYSDIENRKYSISPLYLNSIFTNLNQCKKSSTVYFIGTNSDVYCEDIGLDKNSFVKCLDNIMKHIREIYQDNEIVYIPHGCDTSEYALEICKKYGCLFKSLQYPVEIEFIQINESPLAVYGFTSSALFNIKKLFVNSKVINIYLEGGKNKKSYELLEGISCYYNNNGIELSKIVVSE